mmetsp:Transcript_3398/g.8778  ORF Transcript_3398/g.8778 Transcript_3398/m.8778 type:complete len:204 (-) Transcript_3398:1065-1676(-)
MRDLRCAASTRGKLAAAPHDPNGAVSDTDGSSVPPNRDKPALLPNVDGTFSMEMTWAFSSEPKGPPTSNKALDLPAAARIDVTGSEPLLSTMTDCANIGTARSTVIIAGSTIIASWSCCSLPGVPFVLEWFFGGYGSAIGSFELMAPSRVLLESPSSRSESSAVSEKTFFALLLLLHVDTEEPSRRTPLMREHNPEPLSKLVE